MTAFDAMIPFHSRDLTILPHCVTYLRANARDLRTIFIVGQEDPEIDDTVFVPESAYPFSKSDLADILGSPPGCERYHGWYLQQLLKLYAFRAIPDALPYLLIFDADLILAKPTTFLDPSGVILFDIGEQCHVPYFQHAARILGPHFGKVIPIERLSGIADHMIFYKPIVEHLLSSIEVRARVTEAWRAMIEAVDFSNPALPGMSEYEIYFNFALANYPSMHRIRYLPKCGCASFAELKNYPHMVILSLHYWQRQQA